MDFAVGGRGWCYILEKHGLRKGDFHRAEETIADCRKSGALPLDICAEDKSRVAIGIQRLDIADVESDASWIDYLLNGAHRNYTPFGFWEDLDVYVEMAVEKLDLRNLFELPCAESTFPSRTSKAGAISTAAPP